jgi:hypothetical protein
MMMTSRLRVHHVNHDVHDHDHDNADQTYHHVSSISSDVTFPYEYIMDEWLPLSPADLVPAPCLIEQTLCQPSTSSLHPPRLAKDKEYALSILDQWEQDDSEWIMIKQQQQQQRQQQQRDNDYTAKTALCS